MALVKLDGFTADELGNVIGAESDLVAGDVCRNDQGDEFRWYPMPDITPTKRPFILSKADFNKHGWTQVGMVRHQQILEACAARQGDQDIDLQVRAVYRQYLSAATFEKDDAVALASILVGATIMQQAEADLYLNNWPEA